MRGLLELCKSDSTALCSGWSIRVTQGSLRSSYRMCRLASSRVRTRGDDHASLLTPELGCQMGLSHKVFRHARTDTIRGNHIVLINNVLTTGATLETAAHELKRAGAKHVSAIVFAQA